MFVNAFFGKRHSLRGINDKTSYFCDITGDMTHLSPTGYLVLAKMILDGLCEDIMQHPGRYNQRRIKPYNSN